MDGDLEGYSSKFIVLLLRAVVRSFAGIMQVKILLFCVLFTALSVGDGAICFSSEDCPANQTLCVQNCTTKAIENNMPASYGNCAVDLNETDRYICHLSPCATNNPSICTAASFQDTSCCCTQDYCNSGYNLSDGPVRDFPIDQDDDFLTCGQHLCFNETYCSTGNITCITQYSHRANLSFVCTTTFTSINDNEPEITYSGCVPVRNNDNLPTSCQAARSLQVPSVFSCFCNTSYCNSDIEFVPEDVEDAIPNLVLPTATHPSSTDSTDGMLPPTATISASSDENLFVMSPTTTSVGSTSSDRSSTSQVIITTIAAVIAVVMLVVFFGFCAFKLKRKLIAHQKDKEVSKSHQMSIITPVHDTTYLKIGRDRPSTCESVGGINVCENTASTRLSTLDEERANSLTNEEMLDYICGHKAESSDTDVFMADSVLDDESSNNCNNITFSDHYISEQNMVHAIRDSDIITDDDDCHTTSQSHHINTSYNGSIQFVVTSSTDTEMTTGGEHPDHYVTEDGVHISDEN
ncbi:uncharacterized protein [Dysidea avara]|uniref:uncharacterized protein isoform X2 n=1 Tax=Dysidea avara TaxID=196820 RepID=UPI0033296051